jgi:hypothetical protein
MSPVILADIRAEIVFRRFGQEATLPPLSRVSEPEVA